MISSYLTHLADLGHVPASLLLSHGVRGYAETLPAYLARGTLKACYRNATLAALEHPHLVYVEGYAVLSDLPIPFEHAWVFDISTDRFYDVTWPETGGEHLGLAFRPSYVSAIISRSKVYGLLGINARHLPSDPAECLIVSERNS